MSVCCCRRRRSSTLFCIALIVTCVLSLTAMAIRPAIKVAVIVLSSALVAVIETIARLIVATVEAAFFCKNDTSTLNGNFMLS